MESASSDGYGFLRLVAFILHRVVGTRRGVMRVWSGLDWTGGRVKAGNGEG